MQLLCCHASSAFVCAFRAKTNGIISEPAMIGTFMGSTSLKSVARKDVVTKATNSKVRMASMKYCRRVSLRMFVSLPSEDLVEYSQYEARMNGKFEISPN